MSDRQAWSEVAEHLIGVIDLLDGKAVHGIAGDRQRYAPVRGLYSAGQAAEGNPIALAKWYREQFRIRRFYIADLDALQNKPQQRASIESLILHGNAADRWLIDPGLCQEKMVSQTSWMRDIGAAQPGVQWIIASESATSTDSIQHITRGVAAESLVLGVDFHGGRFVGPSSGFNHWIDTAQQAGVRQGLVLDVAAVGTASGPQTTDRCRSLSTRLPDWRWISGGGCRNVNDVHAFRAAGCQSCLVASALLP